ncbi:MAG: hypothetical protein KBT35_08790 [Firmicutes bacterium]|nr:hypothetical protein [Candidatus Colivicinus equi]
MKEFKFKFSEDEVIDYYTYMLSSQTSNRLKQIFFIFSVPLLLLLSYYFFKLDNTIIKIVFIVVAVGWAMIIGPRFWKSYTRINIGKNFLKKNNITKFEEVDVKVADTYMLVNNKRYEMNDKIKIVKTGLVTIFFFPGQPVAIPNRCLGK